MAVHSCKHTDCVLTSGSSSWRVLWGSGGWWSSVPPCRVLWSIRSCSGSKLRTVYCSWSSTAGSSELSSSEFGWSVRPVNLDSGQDWTGPERPTDLHTPAEPALAAQGKVPLLLFFGRFSPSASASFTLSSVPLLTALQSWGNLTLNQTQVPPDLQKPFPVNFFLEKSSVRVQSGVH